MAKDNDKTISLVLGSGGARGLAHIGVIREIEANGFQIAAISGCSIGALIGGIYAAGKLDEFERWICATTKMDIVALLDLSWGKNGLVKGDKIIKTCSSRLVKCEAALGCCFFSPGQLFFASGPYF